jgi:hypothetical protein
VDVEAARAARPTLASCRSGGFRVVGQLVSAERDELAEADGSRQAGVERRTGSGRVVIVSFSGEEPPAPEPGQYPEPNVPGDRRDIDRVGRRHRVECLARCVWV